MISVVSILNIFYIEQVFVLLVCLFQFVYWLINIRHIYLIQQAGWCTEFILCSTQFINACGQQSFEQAQQDEGKIVACARKCAQRSQAKDLSLQIPTIISSS
ncbi:transmembrane protein, putative (macronuclear) [Tetrahymena thermophila SB210]|uniref:Transmembrane protein, putative n=1 Tax=Tetrahymena thermophila (strain SB210) TaxID=312017 RepID=W7X6S9_TETTS|nr:transmembrane protein, putative [Tetrahymena thermophila SB210]EWS75080.1 transmembrane protein, putative [Tetrahymena thermophila SB210]|eukprot:XP_012652393.1 transmembrane protein, putative [Tetrahymena thermophila SB210]